jgi:hypothetical protein
MRDTILAACKSLWPEMNPQVEFGNVVLHSVPTDDDPIPWSVYEITPTDTIIIVHGFDEPLDSGYEVGQFHTVAEVLQAIAMDMETSQS